MVVVGAVVAPLVELRATVGRAAVETEILKRRE
jgi:hypothetical protein